MASSQPQSREAGYATPAALVLSLALALMGSALVARSVQMLRLCKAEFQRSQQAYALDGGHLSAQAAMIRSGIAGPYHWSFTSDVGWMEAIAEPEAEKVSLEAASRLDDAAFQAFGVVAPAGLKARLAQAAVDQPDVDVGSLDPAPLWRECGASLVSPLGRADRPEFAARQQPGPGPDPASWHVGEAWRVRIATAAGWRDDRIVRFTGDARHPAAVVARKLTRGGGRGGECEDILKTLSGV